MNTEKQPTHKKMPIGQIIFIVLVLLAIIGGYVLGKTHPSPNPDKGGYITG